MKICIYGAGAIGAYLGAQMAHAGCDISLIARGPHLKAMQKKGLTLQVGDDTRLVRLQCTDNPAELGPQDCVIMTLKAHSVAPIVDDMQPLLGPETPVVTAQNGILWWYFHGLDSEFGQPHLESVDPGGRIWKTLGPQRAIGCVVYPSCEIVEPGVVRHLDGNRFTLGEPDGTKSDRVMEISRAMTEAGLKAPVRKRIRDDIWFKLLGNATFNPVSVLTGATLDQMGNDESVRPLILKAMTEAQQVATALGVKFPMSLDKRIDGAAAVTGHKTSMLQDYEQGRQLELDALVASVAELGRVVNVPTPTLDTVLALVRLKQSASA